ncbi:hypothetical protein BRX36_20250 [Sphingomonas sp. S-NIH.Pt1_0416]|uniref:hypothetical protein n=1 Tax=Sphingomonas TaxID=13687 RepID=UPI00064BA597|nr:MULTISPECIES: hypothetical protein [Sphingomonas]RSU58597.1 hypothetical protein BRX36_20250 [Sphingomonas sp. S-NIH.Pt1_0416]
MSAAAPVWPLFEVTVQPYGSSVIAARSRSAAVYARFLDYTDAFNCSFRDFLRVVSVRRASPAYPVGDPYAYVRRNYDRDLRHGTRVTITGEGADLEGRAGTVIHPGRDHTAYAHVVLDGDDHSITVHPFSVVVVSAQPEEAARG